MNRLLAVIPVLALSFGLSAGAEVKLEHTFYHDGDINGRHYSQPSIDVDADGTVAVAVNRSLGPGNSKPSLQESWLILLYSKSGEPIGRLAGNTTGMVDVTFGPDGRLYTAESWFGSGVHVYDRPGVKPRDVPSRFNRTGGYHPDFGHPRGVAVGPDLLLHSTAAVRGEFRNKLVTTKPDGKLVKAIPLPGGAGKVDVAPDGTVYVGNRVLQADGTWKPLKFTVRDVRPDGKLLVALPDGWGIYDPKADRVETKGVWPPGDWVDMALGPDNNVYLTPRNRNEGGDLAYAVADATGKILLQRGSDFDRIRARLPDTTLTSGAPFVFEAQAVRSRDLGYVPRSVQLPFDNRPELKLMASLAPVVNDPLGEPRWTPCPLTGGEDGQWQLDVPAGLHGRYRLRLTAGRGPLRTAVIPGLDPLAISTEVAIRPEGAKAFLVPQTDRNRTGFVGGQRIRLTVPVSPSGDPSTSLRAGVDLSGARLSLQLDGRAAWDAPLGLATIAAKTQQTAVVTVSAETSAQLRPAVYQAVVTNLPPGVASGRAVIHIVSPVRPTLFQTMIHPCGNAYADPVKDARLHGGMGFTHVVSPARWDAKYLDAACRLGFTFHYQLYTHFSPLNVLPQEQGAAKQFVANLAQQLLPFPAFRGFNYHDLEVQPWGGWGDGKRKALYPPLWAEWAKDVKVPDTVPGKQRAAFAKAVATESTACRLYEALGEAIRHVDKRLDRTTMQWWHQPLTVANPDHVSRSQNLISTQHAEEQYFHPVTVANQADLWRRRGMPLWVYGNTSWQEDGSGALMYTDYMTMLARGVQGCGQDPWGMPTAGSARTELSARTATPALRLLHAYGGLSAAAEPDDQVAIWRSFYEACSETHGRHLRATTAAYTACLYAHRTAAIVTDNLVRGGELSRYKAVIVSFELPLPPDLLKPLEAFQKAGGLVLANKQGDSYWCPPGAVKLGPAFRESHALAESNRDSLRHIGVEEDGLAGAPILLKALGDHVQPLADCDDPTTWLSVLKEGDARYVFAVNVKRLPQPPMDLHRYSGYENTRMPAKTVVRLKPGDYTIYDVFAGVQVKPEEKDGQWLVTADMSVFPGAILALLPAPIHHLSVSAEQWRKQGALTVRIEVRGRDGAIRAAVPLEIDIADSRGRTRYHLLRTARNGVWGGHLPLAANDAPGPLRLVATELVSGKQVRAALRVEPPPLPPVTPTPTVEWPNADRVWGALNFHRGPVAVIVEEKQAEALAPAVQVVLDWRAAQRRPVERVAAKTYLADRKTFGWEKFRLGEFATPDIRPRPRKYTLVIAFDTPALPSGVIKTNALPIQLTATDPGPGRGLVQFAAMAAYDTEDAISLSGGDPEGLLAAAKALASPPPVLEPDAEPNVLFDAVAAQEQGETKVEGIRRFVGVPISELAASPDGTRIAAGLKGWGNNLFVLDGQGRALGKDLAGKFFPVRLETFAGGFAVLSHENDPTTLYLKLNDREGKPMLRVAAPGRRVGGVRDCTPNFPEQADNFLKQASFSLTPDGRRLGAAGSKGIAVWDLKARKVVARDDSVHYNAPGPESHAWPDTASFPQVRLSPDGRRFVLQHNGKLFMRDAATGATLDQVSLPVGSTMGRVQLFDGHLLVVGDREFFAFRDGKLLWHWKAPDEVTASAFAPDGLRYAIGEVGGAVRLMNGGGQVGGFVPAGGGMITTLGLLPESGRVAFATATGGVGVVEFSGRVVWQGNVDARAVIRLAGPSGETVVGDGRGIVRRFGADGKKLWETALTPLVWRPDTHNLLLAPDPTPTLRLPAPKSPQTAVPAGAPNLAPQATVKYLPSRSWWKERIDPDRSVSLNDGKRDSPPGGWFDRTKLEYLAFVPSPPTWELTWKEPVAIGTVVVCESPDHPEAVPEEVKVEAWLDGDWKEVVHTHWNRDVIHVHQFPAITTAKLRYMPVGDLANKLWLSEIEVYGPASRR